MIAPLRQTDPPPRFASGALRAARRSVAELFFSDVENPSTSAPPVSAWKAWLFAVWTVAVSAVYFVVMLRR